MNILDDIVEHKRGEVQKRKKNVTMASLVDNENFHRTTYALRRSLQEQCSFGIIAEFKRSSPSAGSIRNDVNSNSMATSYQENGAAGISILTDERFFSGTLDDLRSARRAVSLPILRKDFIIDDYQLFEAKAAGADAVLLIAAILEKPHLADLFIAASELKLECLVELYENKEIDILDFDRMKLVGINNRDLRTFKVDITHSVILAQHIPADITVVSESGIHSIADLKLLKDAGIRAALIGEYFMKSEQPGRTLKLLLEGMENETPR
jgi:indole-3-glycerol phosphate synthase